MSETERIANLPFDEFIGWSKTNKIEPNSFDTEVRDIYGAGEYPDWYAPTGDDPLVMRQIANAQRTYEDIVGQIGTEKRALEGVLRKMDKEDPGIGRDTALARSKVFKRWASLDGFLRAINNPDKRAAIVADAMHYEQMRQAASSNPEASAEFEATEAESQSTFKDWATALYPYRSGTDALKRFMPDDFGLHDANVPFTNAIISSALGFTEMPDHPADRYWAEEYRASVQQTNPGYLEKMRKAQDWEANAGWVKLLGANLLAYAPLGLAEGVAIRGAVAGVGRAAAASAKTSRAARIASSGRGLRATEVMLDAGAGAVDAALLTPTEDLAETLKVAGLGAALGGGLSGLVNARGFVKGTRPTLGRVRLDEKAKTEQALETGTETIDAAAEQADMRKKILRKEFSSLAHVYGPDVYVKQNADAVGTIAEALAEGIFDSAAIRRMADNGEDIGLVASRAKQLIDLNSVDKVADVSDLIGDTGYVSKYGFIASREKTDRYIEAINQGKATVRQDQIDVMAVALEKYGYDREAEIIRVGFKSEPEAFETAIRQYAEIVADRVNSWVDGIVSQNSAKASLGDLMVASRRLYEMAYDMELRGIEATKKFTIDISSDIKRLLPGVAGKSGSVEFEFDLATLGFRSTMEIMTSPAPGEAARIINHELSHVYLGMLKIADPNKYDQLSRDVARFFQDHAESLGVDYKGFNPRDEISVVEMFARYLDNSTIASLSTKAISEQADKYGKWVSRFLDNLKPWTEKLRNEMTGKKGRHDWKKRLNTVSRQYANGEWGNLLDRGFRNLDEPPRYIPDLSPPSPGVLRPAVDNRLTGLRNELAAAVKSGDKDLAARLKTKIKRIESSKASIGRATIAPSSSSSSTKMRFDGLTNPVNVPDGVSPSFVQGAKRVDLKRVRTALESSIQKERAAETANWNYASIKGAGIIRDTVRRAFVERNLDVGNLDGLSNEQILAGVADGVMRDEGMAGLTDAVSSLAESLVNPYANQAANMAMVRKHGSLSNAPAFDVIAEMADRGDPWATRVMADPGHSAMPGSETYLDWLTRSAHPENRASRMAAAIREQNILGNNDRAVVDRWLVDAFSKQDDLRMRALYMLAEGDENRYLKALSDLSRRTPSEGSVYRPDALMTENIMAGLANDMNLQQGVRWTPNGIAASILDLTSPNRVGSEIVPSVFARDIATSAQGNLDNIVAGAIDRASRRIGSSLTEKMAGMSELTGGGFLDPLSAYRRSIADRTIRAGGSMDEALKRLTASETFGGRILDGLAESTGTRKRGVSSAIAVGDGVKASSELRVKGQDPDTLTSAIGSVTGRRSMHVFSDDGAVPIRSAGDLGRAQELIVTFEGVKSKAGAEAALNVFRNAISSSAGKAVKLSGVIDGQGRFRLPIQDAPDFPAQTLQQHLEYALEKSGGTVHAGTRGSYSVDIDAWIGSPQGRDFKDGWNRALTGAGDHARQSGSGQSVRPTKASRIADQREAAWLARSLEGKTTKERKKLVDLYRVSQRARGKAVGVLADNPIAGSSRTVSTVDPSMADAINAKANGMGPLEIVADNRPDLVDPDWLVQPVRRSFGETKKFHLEEDASMSAAEVKAMATESAEYYNTVVGSPDEAASKYTVGKHSAEAEELAKDLPPDFTADQIRLAQGRNVHSSQLRVEWIRKITKWAHDAHRSLFKTPMLGLENLVKNVDERLENLARRREQLDMLDTSKLKDDQVKKLERSRKLIAANYRATLGTSRVVNAMRRVYLSRSMTRYLVRTRVEALFRGASGDERKLFERWLQHQKALVAEQRAGGREVPMSQIKLSPAELDEFNGNPMMETLKDRWRVVQQEFESLALELDPTFRDAMLHTESGLFVPSMPYRPEYGANLHKVALRDGPDYSKPVPNLPKGVKVHKFHGAADAYVMDVEFLLNQKLAELVSVKNQRDALRIGEMEGFALKATDTDRPPPIEIDGKEIRWKRIAVNAYNKDDFYWMPEPMARAWDGFTERNRSITPEKGYAALWSRVADWYTMSMLMAPVEAMRHSSRIMSVLASQPKARKLNELGPEDYIPFFGKRFGALKRIVNVFNTEDAMYLERYMSETGAFPDRAFSEVQARQGLWAAKSAAKFGEEHKLTKSLEKTSEYAHKARHFLFDPPTAKRDIVTGKTKEGSKLLDRIWGFDVRARMASAQLWLEAAIANGDLPEGTTFKQLVESKDPKIRSLDQKFYEHMLQYGMYSEGLMTRFAKGLRRTRLNPFVATQFGMRPAEIGRSLGLHRMPADKLPADVKASMALQTMYSQWIGYFTTLQLANYWLSGHFTWDNQDGRIYDLEVGEDDNGNPVYLLGSLLEPSGARGLRTLGINIASDKRLGENIPERVLGHATQRVPSEFLTMMVGGPATQGVTTAVMGRTPFIIDGTMMRTSERQLTNLSQARVNVLSSVAQANIIAQMGIDFLGDSFGWQTDFSPEYSHPTFHNKMTELGISLGTVFLGESLAGGKSDVVNLGSGIRTKEKAVNDYTMREALKFKNADREKAKRILRRYQTNPDIPLHMRANALRLFQNIASGTSQSAYRRAAMASQENE